MARKKTTTKKKTSSKKMSLRPSKKNKIILGSLMILLSMALFFSFVSFYFTWQDDQSLLTEFADRNEHAKNLLNKFGASVSHFFVYRGFGVASLIFTLLLCITGLYLFLSLDRKGLWKKWIWGLIFMIWISIGLGFFAATKPLLGGLVGYEMNDFLQDYTGKIGVFLILLFGLVLILVRFFQVTPEDIGHFFRKKTAAVATEFKGSSQKKSKNSDNLITDAEEEAPIVLDTYTHKKDIPPLKKKESAEDGFEVTVPKEEEAIEDLAMKVEKIVVEKEEKDNIADKLVQDFGEFDPRLELGNYKFPTMELLDQHGVSGGITINQEELEDNKNKIVETLKNYKIGIAQIKATIGPTVTLYEIVPEAGIRISKIKNLEDDIALSLAALGIRIIAPIPGKGTIGIEVPNKNATVVSMRSVIATSKFQKAEMQLPIAFGKTI
ncbi:MAG: DNA translocase FtsK, partial [Pricia sp.]|nr:DNA translocase FtsK [Pricia sp.]